MLLWAVFTLGYLFGVFFTLAVFLKRDVSGDVDVKKPIELAGTLNSWEVHNKLIEVNSSGSFQRRFPLFYGGKRKGTVFYGK